MFPDGLRGLMIVSMVLAMMSSLDSVFNCVSTIFTLDVYKRFVNPTASNERLVWVGRGITVVAAGCSILWLPIIHHNQSGLYLATQNALTHLSPTVVAVFLLGILWPRANGEGALAGLVVGFTFGTIRFMTNFWADCPDGTGGTFQCMNFNHMALIIFVLVIVTTVMVSGWSHKPDDEQLWGTCLYPTKASQESRLDDEDAMDEQRRRGTAFRANPEISKFLQAIGSMLLAVMLSLCVGFGYTDEHERCENEDPISCYKSTAISGGMLAILCNLGAAVFLISWFGLQMWYRGLEPARIVEHNPYSTPVSKASHADRGRDSDDYSYEDGPDPMALVFGSPKPTCDAEAQTEMKAVDLKNSIVYGENGRFTFNHHAKEEDLDQWSVGSDFEVDPPKRPVVIQKPISHVHRELPSPISHMQNRELPSV